MGIGLFQITFLENTVLNFLLSNLHIWSLKSQRGLKAINIVPPFGHSRGRASFIIKKDS